MDLMFLFNDRQLVYTSAKSSPIQPKRQNKPDNELYIPFKINKFQ